jgi:hypothetical protein
MRLTLILSAAAATAAAALVTVPTSAQVGGRSEPPASAFVSANPATTGTTLGASASMNATPSASVEP